MDQTLPILTDEETRRAMSPDGESGFGSLATARGHLPLKAMEVHAKIDGLFSEVNVDQTFINALDEPLEATYVFPLPDRAAVTRFRLQVGARVIEGVLKERAEARRAYDQAIRSGQRAAITEEERSGVFTMRVGNIMPGEEATVRLTLVGPLPYCDGEVTFRFPLVVAPRYIPGAALSGASVGTGVVPDTDAVPDASRITPPVLLPGFPNPVRLSLTVDVHSGGLPLRDFRSSLHAVVEDNREGVRHIGLKPGERLDRDFILRFRLGEAAIKTSLTLKADDEDSQQGTFVLTLVPPLGLAKDHRPRDLVFLLDRSGSMGGWKIVAARRALARMVDTLTDRDRFAVLAFDDRVETPPALGGKGLVPATDRNRFRAVEFLSRIQSRGGTEMAQPLDRAVNDLLAQDRERDRILVLVTDGQVGNEDQILRNLGKRVQDIRIFALGIDRAVNEGFLKRLASLGGGWCEFVEGEDRLDEVMNQVHRRIGMAVLTGLRLEPADLRVEAESVVPARLPDLFAGAPLCVMGRYHGSANGSISLQAVDSSGSAWSETVQASSSLISALSCVWARGHIRELEDRYVLGHPELEKQIVDTSLRFNVLCRFTAFVAVDKSEIVNAGGQLHEITQPVEAPQGWAMFRTDRSLERSVACRIVGGSVDSESVDSMLQEFIDSGEPGSTMGTPSFMTPFLRSTPASPAPTSEFRKARKAKSTGILGRLLRRDQGDPPDLTAYRQRAAALLADLKKVEPSDQPARLLALQDLAGKLAALIADLTSIGISSTELRPLKKLVLELQKFLANKSVNEAKVLEIWQKCEQVLRAFAVVTPGGETAKTKRREGFWK